MAHRKRLWGIMIMAAMGSACGGDDGQGIELLEPAPAARAWTTGVPPGAPAEFEDETRITDKRLLVWIGDGWAGSDAYLSYWASNARVQATAVLQDWEGRTLSSDTGAEEEGWGIPVFGSVSANAAIPYSTPCGYKNHGRGTFRTWHQWSGWQWGLKETSDAKLASLNACSCDADAVISDPDYDPYNPDCPDSGDGGEGGTGEFFEPGDNTGGQTVDWRTGQGTGWPSACGSSAVVEYVCVDIWDEENQVWDQYDCGYATTCGF